MKIKKSKKVKPSPISEVSYNSKKKEMVITFWNNSVYKYKNISPAVSTGIAFALSRGKYFWRNIRDKKETIKLQDGIRTRAKKK